MPLLALPHGKQEHRVATYTLTLLTLVAWSGQVSLMFLVVHVFGWQQLQTVKNALFSFDFSLTPGLALDRQKPLQPTLRMIC